ncbi:Hint domain-containing protein [Roseovarius phycicola]|uniref:Hint domain-containing protein n=1 Tax=Roseovarius phycicola TaxID=3080976 RepID=A0ABZ2HJE7_9RHOB
MTACKISQADTEDTCIPLKPIGILPGAVVLTLDGETPVEALRPGARVITRDQGMAVLRRITRQTVETYAVQILAGSLGHTRPERDVILPAEQPMLIRDWRAEALFGAAQALVPARRLVDGEFITDLGMQRMALFTLQFDMPHVIYADGLELGSDPVAQSTSRAA